MNDIRDLAASCLLTASEVAVLTGLSVHAVRKRAARGQVWKVRKGRDWLFWRDDWEQQVADKDAASGQYTQHSDRG